MYRRLVVLMSTYNGERFLREQIDSILAQNLSERLPVQVEILVRDDGSEDSTVRILEDYRKRGKLAYYHEENIGLERSFWKLLLGAPQADYYAFCDQDDVWFTDKLYRAVRAIRRRELQKKEPVLYCSAVVETDASLNRIGENGRGEKRHTDFAHSLIYSTAAGCTQVFNSEARDLLLRYDMDRDGITYHDYLAHKVVTLFGTMIYSTTPGMFYRQHGSNVYGAVKRGITIRRIRRFLVEDVHEWSEAAKAILRVYGEDPGIPKERLDCLRMFAHYRDDIRMYFRLLTDRHFHGSIREDALLIPLILFRRL